MNKILGASLLHILILSGVSCALRPAQPILDQTRNAPRVRMATYATATLGSNFADANQLGQHGYENGRLEKTGIIYTCRGGHIDIAHLRKAADWTAFLAERTYVHLVEGETDFTFKFYEPSVYHVHIEYPDNWSSRSAAEKNRIAHDISIDAGRYFSHAGMTWHEILTWYNYSITGIYPQYPSSFSWEDSYSNTLGDYLAGIALRDAERGYDEAMTVALQREIESLGPQTKSTSRRASKAMRGRWYTGRAFFMVKMKARNLDIGLDDGLVSPWLASPVPECPDATPKAYPTQNADALDQYGIRIKLEIDPKVRKKRNIFKGVYPGGAPQNARVEPRIHFPVIMEQIRREVEERYSPELLDGPGT